MIESGEVWNHPKVDFLNLTPCTPLPGYGPEKTNGRVLTFGLPRDINRYIGYRFEAKGPIKLGSLALNISK